MKPNTPSNGSSSNDLSTTSVAGTIGTAASRAHGAVDQAANAADQAVDRARPIIERVADSAHQAVEKAAGLAEPAADWVVEKRDGLRATQDRLLADTRGYVNGNPLKAVAIAVVAGLLLGRILR
ncbi:MAG: hypothetical protein ABI630_01945 [Betaproteobacteria bacterium]